MQLPKISLLVFGIVLVSAVGCESRPVEPRNTISGTVSYDGTPISNGEITFTSQEDIAKGTEAIGIIKDGKYSLEVTPGNKTVRISSRIPDGPEDATGVTPTKETIPAKYNTQSTLTETIPESSKTIPFELAK